MEFRTIYNQEVWVILEYHKDNKPTSYIHLAKAYCKTESIIMTKNGIERSFLLETPSGREFDNFINEKKIQMVFLNEKDAAFGLLNYFKQFKEIDYE